MSLQGEPSPEEKTAPAPNPEVEVATKKSKPSLVQIGKESVADGWKLTVSSTEDEAQNPGNARQVLDGSLIGACLVFFAAMLGVQHLDTPLTVASVAFAIAIPPLTYGFLWASYKFAEKLKQVPGWRILGALFIGGWVVEAFGVVAVLVGVFCVILHTSHLAAAAFIWTIIITLLLSFIGSVVGLIIYAVVKYNRSQQQAKPEELSASPSIQPQPALPASQSQGALEPPVQPRQSRKRQTKAAATTAETKREGAS